MFITHETTCLTNKTSYPLTIKKNRIIHVAVDGLGRTREYTYVWLIPSRARPVILGWWARVRDAWHARNVLDEARNTIHISKVVGKSIWIFLLLLWTFLSTLWSFRIYINFFYSYFRYWKFSYYQFFFNILFEWGTHKFWGIKYSKLNKA